LHNNIAIHVADAAAPVPGGVDTKDDLNDLISII
jgi:hypothetical protein